MSLIKDSSIYLIGELSANVYLFYYYPIYSRKLGRRIWGASFTTSQTFLPFICNFIGLSQDGAVARYFYVW